MVQKGILMEVSKRHWIVMTPDGEFLKVPHRGREARLGEEVNFTLQETPGRWGWLRRNPWIMGGLAAAVLVIAMILPLFQPVDVNAQSYVYLDDTESSLVIGVNKDHEVISVDGMNSKGKRLAERIKGDMAFKGVHVDDFVANLLAHAKTDYKGLLNTENGVFLSQIPSNSKILAGERIDLEGTLNNIKEKVGRNPELKDTQLLYTMSLPDELKSRAKEYGVSPTKYALWLLACEEGYEIRIDEIDNHSTELVAILESFQEKYPLTEAEWLEIMNRHDPEMEPDQKKPADPKDSDLQQPPGEKKDHKSKGNQEKSGNDPVKEHPAKTEPEPEGETPSGGGSEDPPPETGTGEGNGSPGSDGNGSFQDSGNNANVQ
ncbi:Anti-sigma factor N-terminus [Kroppenstedtia eburnea]|uniref:Anti-sigma factor N-terminus n=1 Tax=Kroppenstedtia eburnea TaxID=714067 RepID=A0A1N7Q7H3_9BACL|nr:Anti-sigma factor N-terminus [Kroppenstedtia eburnea]